MGKARPLEELVVSLVEQGQALELPAHLQPVILVAVQLALSQAGIWVDMLDRELSTRQGPIQVPALEVDGVLVGLAGRGHWRQQALATLRRLGQPTRHVNFKKPATPSLMRLKPDATSLEELVSEDLLRPIGFRTLSKLGIEAIEACLVRMLPLIQAYGMERATAPALRLQQQRPRL